MRYKEQQRKRAEALRGIMFGDPGGGIFRKKTWPFVLNNPMLNLHHSIGSDVVNYFNKYNIPLWEGTKDTPTGHLLSSQVACLNHLFYFQNNPVLATKILKIIDASVNIALPLNANECNDPNGFIFVDFEVIGKQNYLGEKSHTRGANSTSIDAVMLALMLDGTVKLFFIEWKYTESYTTASKADEAGGATRLRIYSPFLENSECPLKANNIRALFVEPYYQLMRQTLLAYQMVNAGEYGATDYMHIHVIPTANKELKGRNNAPILAGNNLDSAWKGVLKQPKKYLAIDPKDFIAPALQCEEDREIKQYLENRYWAMN